MASARFRELLRKYGKVGLGVHFSISAASTATLYAAIKNNVDVQSIFDKFGLKGPSGDNKPQGEEGQITDQVIGYDVEVAKKRNRTAEMAASSGGALALALLCNKALFPVRVPITLVVTPPLARFLTRRQIIKGSTL